ncbi:UDP-glucose--hexose-1-phosphate uridylyltransferase [Rhodobacteraceae bacterium CCMM004]|nr:UDP-glucose--hexose-1-phosphate uridylyltransferase [Rhodobacteraceae bacterium CCMM004]
MSSPSTGGARPHRRYNPLNGTWVLVSPQRGNRPWRGAQEEAVREARPAHDPACALCPGVARATGEANPHFTGPHVFANDFPALLPADEPDPDAGPAEPLFRHQAVSGETRVICFSERHDLSLARMPVAGVRHVVDTWCAEFQDLSARYANVLIFENKGAAMGCSNPHPHGQIWATDYLPCEVAREDDAQRDHHRRTGRPLLLDYARAEIAAGTRIVFRTQYWLCLVPYWATWPFETLLLPTTHAQRLCDLSAAARTDLARALKRLTTTYDNLFQTDFPYSMGWHHAPCDGRDGDHWVLHAHFYPPLLRSATVRKYMVGFELLGEAQRDLTPETAAALLRAQPEVHFRQKQDAVDAR